MLGIGRSRKIWRWGACGKHPVARDYFKISYNDPVFTAFESWVEKGYTSLTKNRKLDSEVYSWRFLAKGLKKGDLISGIVKDSSDSIGRPYPLLIIGKGKFEGWENSWEYLPFYFEKTWEQLEYISSRRLSRLNDFENDINAIKNPDNNSGRKKNSDVELAQDSELLADKEMVKNTADLFSNEMMALIPLVAQDETQEQSKYLNQAGAWSSMLKTYGSGVPSAIFIGGGREKHYLALFIRPINTEDFIRLWSASSS
jgi:type VI secretion system ImpM family protein